MNKVDISSSNAVPGSERGSTTASSWLPIHSPDGRFRPVVSPHRVMIRAYGMRLPEEVTRSETGPEQRMGAEPSTAEGELFTTNWPD